MSGAAKVVQECVYPLLPRDVRDSYDAACHESYAGYPDWSSAKWTELLESVDPFLEAKPSLDDELPSESLQKRNPVAPFPFDFLFFLTPVGRFVAFTENDKT